MLLWLRRDMTLGVLTMRGTPRWKSPLPSTLNCFDQRTFPLSGQSDIRTHGGDLPHRELLLDIWRSAQLLFLVALLLRLHDDLRPCARILLPQLLHAL